MLGRNLVASGSVSLLEVRCGRAYNWDNSTWTGFDGSNWVAGLHRISSGIIWTQEISWMRRMCSSSFNHEYDASTQTKGGIKQPHIRLRSCLGQPTPQGPGSGFLQWTRISAGGSGFRRSWLLRQLLRFFIGRFLQGPGRAGTYDDSQHGPGFRQF